MTEAFSLRIFVADGDPDGLRVVERFNASARAVMFPRALLPQVRQRPELQQTGVYLLLGPRPDGEGDLLYIGEGDPILPRLLDHQAKKDFWTRAIGFVSGSGALNKAHVQFLESRLIALARAAKRLPLDNAKQPAEPTLGEADRADMEVFPGHMLGMLPVLGVQAFERAPVAPLAVAGPDTGQAVPAEAPVLLHCAGKGIEATGYESTQGFVVCKGSQAVADAVPSLQENWPARIQQRRDLLDSGVLVPEGDALRFTQDYVFTSPTLAAVLVLGRHTNGRTKWKDAQGQTLKALQEAAAGLA